MRPRHVEVGVADAHLDAAALGQGELDGVLDDVVDPVHALAGDRRRGPDGGERTR